MHRLHRLLVESIQDLTHLSAAAACADVSVLIFAAPAVISRRLLWIVRRGGNAHLITCRQTYDHAQLQYLHASVLLPALAL